MAESWEKQDFETPKQYKYFCVYRDMGVDRSFLKVQQKLGKPKTFVKALGTYSVKNNWVSRCDDYQVYLEEKQRKQNEKEILDMNKRHIQQSLLLQKKIIDKMKDASAEELKLGECAKLLDIAVKIERLARGCNTVGIVAESNQNVVVKQKENDKIHNLSDEDLEKINELLEKSE